METISLFSKRRSFSAICLITFFVFVIVFLQTQQKINVIQSDGHVVDFSGQATEQTHPKPLSKTITLVSTTSVPVFQTDKHEVKFRRPIARNRSQQSPLPTSIMCLVLTTSNTLLSKAKAVNDTWGRRCNKTVFFTNRPSTIPNVVYLDLAKDGRKHLTDKVVRIFEYVHKQYIEYDWFLKADDDTYVILENLRHFLTFFKSNKPVYLGQNYKLYTKQGYNSGGAGYILSKEALNKLMFGIKYKNCAKDGNDEDVDIGKCLDRQGVPVYNTTDKFNRETFHGGTIEDHMVGPLSDLLKKYPSTPAKTGTCDDEQVAVCTECGLLLSPSCNLQICSSHCSMYLETMKGEN